VSLFVTYTEFICFSSNNIDHEA